MHQRSEWLGADGGSYQHTFYFVLDKGALKKVTGVTGERMF
jgi:hypothetical protein